MQNTANGTLNTFRPLTPKARPLAEFQNLKEASRVRRIAGPMATQNGKQIMFSCVKNMVWSLKQAGYTRQGDTWYMHPTSGLAVDTSDH